MRKMKRNNKAVDEVIGIILMVTITVAIAVMIYYVSGCGRVMIKNIWLV